MKKKLIRSNVFETNSSSSHSVSIADDTKEFVLDTIYPNQNGVVTLTGGEYGWDWFKTNESLEKANYVVQSIGLTDILEEVIIEQTGATSVVFEDNGGYVDHDSYGTAPQSKEEIRQFIFNKNSWLFGGNDNDSPTSDFYIVPEFKDGKIFEPEYKFVLSIEGYDKRSKFLEKPKEEEIVTAINALLSSVYLTENNYFDDDNSIYAQIARNRDKIYELNSYKKPIDFKNNICFFVKNTWQEAKRLFDMDSKNKDLDWSTEGYTKVREIEQSLLDQEDSGYVKKVRFYVTEL